MEANYLIRLREGEVFHIYYRKGNGICLRRAGEEKKAEILLRDGFYDFDCHYDKEKNVVHMICQNSEGSITHIMWEDGVWKKRELLCGKLKLPYPKHFRMEETADGGMFFYTIRHDGNVLLVSQRTEGEEMPSVIDYTGDDNAPFQIAVTDGIPCIVYTNAEGSLQMQVLEDRRWRTRHLPFQSSGERPISFLCDSRGCFHLITAKRNAEGTEILHRRKNKGIWEERLRVTELRHAPYDTVLYTEHTALTFAAIEHEGGKVYTYQNRVWEEDAVKERLMEGQKRAVKIILCDGKRSETVGRVDASGVHLIFLSHTEKGKKDMESDIRSLQERIRQMERKIAAIEATYRKEK